MTHRCPKCSFQFKDQDRKMTPDGRAIVEEFWGQTNEEINANLNKRRNNFSVIICNVETNFNVGTIIRSANAFLAKRVILFGSKKYNRLSTLGTHHYIDICNCKTTESLRDTLNYYTPYNVIIGIENNIKETVALKDLWWPVLHTYMIFGNERTGIPDELLKICDYKVAIPHFGTARSLNVACAASIVMHDYINKQ